MGPIQVDDSKGHRLLVQFHGCVAVSPRRPPELYRLCCILCKIIRCENIYFLKTNYSTEHAKRYTVGIATRGDIMGT